MAPKHKSKKKRKNNINSGSSSNNNDNASTTMTKTPTSATSNINPPAESRKTKKQRVIESTTTTTSSSSSSITYETATSSKTIISDDNNNSESSLIPTLPPLFTHTLFKISKKNTNKNPQPTPIQRHTWPLLLENISTKKNHNLIAISPTGSGKTLAYVLPMVHHCLQPQAPTSSKSPRGGTGGGGGGALVLLPTRELALQVHETISLVLKLWRKKCQDGCDDVPVVRNFVIHGGGGDDSHHLLPPSSSSSSIATTLIISATPGKLIPLCRSVLAGRFAPSFWVLDEADRLLTHGDLKDQVLDIWNRLTNRRSPSPASDDWDDGATRTSRPTVCLFSASFIGRRDERNDDGNEAVDKLAPQPRYVVRLDVMDRNGDCEETSDGKDVTTVSMTESMVSRGDDTIDTPDDDLTPTTTTTTSTIDDDSNDIKRDNNQKPRRDIDTLTRIPSHIRQILHVCSQHKKPRKLLTTLGHIRREQGGGGRKRGRVGLLMIFFKTIKVLRYVAKTLKQEGIKAMELHGHMPQSQREKTMQDFRAGKVATLLTTDIAARGIHVANVTHVINYDFPTLEQYVHRCGRAGRRHQNNNDDDNNNEATVATVYSFFHRELKPMAKDVLTLLRSGPPDTFIDPNLIALVDEDDKNDDDDEAGGDGKRNRRRRRRKRRGDERDNDDEGNDEGDCKNGAMENGIKNNINDDDKDDRRRDRKTRPVEDGGTNENRNEDEDYDDDDEFRSLSKKNIFRRATHVSDASSSSDDDDE